MLGTYNFLLYLWSEEDDESKSGGRRGPIGETQGRGGGYNVKYHRAEVACNDGGEDFSLTTTMAKMWSFFLMHR